MVLVGIWTLDCWIASIDFGTAVPWQDFDTFVVGIVGCWGTAEHMDLRDIDRWLSVHPLVL